MSGNKSPRLLYLSGFIPLLFSLLVPSHAACPDGCDCLEQDGMGVVFCVNKIMTSIPDLDSNTDQLFMQGHKLGTIRNRAFTKVPKLKKLILEDCGIDALEPGAFAGLNFLTVLDLKRNRITELRQGMFAGIPKINHIILDSNDLRSIHEFAFDTLRNELRIDMENNYNLKDISPKAFKGSKIKELYFFNCSLSNDSLLSVAPLKDSLNVFYLSTNRIPLSIPFNLFKGFYLLNLNLVDSGITDVSFLHHVTADDISLDYNNVGDFNLSYYPSLSQTRILRLSHTSRKVLDGNSFSKMTSLMQLYLAHNEISTLPESLQTVFMNLNRLNLDGNPIHCNCELLWFKKWLTVNEGTANGPKCTTPKQGPIVDFPDAEFKCSAPFGLQIKERANSESDVVLECSAEGDPPPVITWTLPDGTHQVDADDFRRGVDTNEATVIANPSGGRYTCSASNQAGNVSREIVLLPYQSSAPTNVLFSNIIEAFIILITILTINGLT